MTDVLRYQILIDLCYVWHTLFWQVWIYEIQIFRMDSLTKMSLYPAELFVRLFKILLFPVVLLVFVYCRWYHCYCYSCRILSPKQRIGLMYVTLTMSTKQLCEQLSLYMRFDEDVCLCVCMVVSATHIHPHTRTQTCVFSPFCNLLWSRAFTGLRTKQSSVAPIEPWQLTNI